ncbi:MAG: NAD(P)-dependent oxidoreductase [Halieaceae bacterium]|nr:NAD(P)-dependent oxidoreductase [Halieaceae bacterium]
MDNSTRLQGKRILVTGPAGQIAFPLAARLATDNEVWGIARFSDPATRQRCEDAGIRTAVVDLESPDWSTLPERFDHLLHLAAIIEPGEDYNRSIRINAEGTGRLMQRFRQAESALVMSTCGVYASPQDGNRAVVENDPLGGSPQPYAPTYCVSKIAQEAVTRFAAEAFELPTTIARMNAAYGDNGGLAAIYLDMILADLPIPVLPGRVSVGSPIHEDDIFAQTPLLLAGAGVPATIVNWGGDEPVGTEELCRYMARQVGKEVAIVESDAGIHQYRLDNSLRTQLAGTCRVSWQTGVDRMIAARQ